MNESPSNHGVVLAVHLSPSHGIGKQTRDSILLIAGLGVEGDAHAGVTVKHRSRIAKDATQPNLRQVHLIHSELHDELRSAGFTVAPGRMGENITTRGVELLNFPTGTRLHIGAAIVEVMGLRNPCSQLDKIQPGLMAATLGKDERGQVVRKAGVMSVVVVGGEVKAGDVIRAELPTRPHKALEPV